MKHPSRRFVRREFTTLSLIATLALAGSAHAQIPPPDSTATPPAPGVSAPAVPSPARVGMGTEAPATMLRGGPMGELMSVYPPRPVEEIRRQLDNSRALQKSADNDIAESRQLAEAADGQVRIMTEELQTTKTRLSVAKKMNNDGDRASLALDAKRQEAEKKYLERLRDAMRADAARLDSESGAAQARVKALELEVEVARRHAELAAIAAPNLPAASDLSGYRTMLRRMLDAQRYAAKRGKEAAEKRQQVADRRLKQLDALVKLAR